MKADEIRTSLELAQSDGADLNRLLSTAVTLLKDSDSSYCWAGIYERTAAGTQRLGPSTGSKGSEPQEQARCEVAVQIRTDSRVYGRIEVESQHPNAFDEATLNELECVADWIADAFELREALCPR